MSLKRKFEDVEDEEVGEEEEDVEGEEESEYDEEGEEEEFEFEEEEEELEDYGHVRNLREGLLEDRSRPPSKRAKTELPSQELDRKPGNQIRTGLWGFDDFDISLSGLTGGHGCSSPSNYRCIKYP